MTESANSDDVLTWPITAFRAAVDADVRDQASVEVASVLRSSNCRERWLYELRRLRGSLDAQRAAKKAEVRANAIELRLAGDAAEAEHAWAEYWRWFAGNARFGSAVDEKLAEARFLTTLTSERSLRRAIDAHRRDLLAVGEEPSRADEELWANVS